MDYNRATMDYMISPRAPALLVNSMILSLFLLRSRLFPRHFSEAPKVFLTGLLFSSALLGCDSGGGVPAGIASVTALPTNVTVVQGSSFSLSVTAENTNGIDDNVRFSLEGNLPDGSNLDRSQCYPSGESRFPIVAGAGTCTLIVSIPRTGAPGKYQPTVCATFARAQADSCSEEIETTVVSGVQFSLAILGDTEIPDGVEIEMAVTATRDTGFDEAISLRVQQAGEAGLPAGIVSFFDPQPIPSGATESTLMLLNNGAASGTYDLILDGTVGDGFFAMVDFSITVP